MPWFNIPVIVLSLLGLVIAVFVGEKWGPVPGIIVGLLLVGGFGWRALAGIIGLGRAAVSPVHREKTGPFWEAWEERHGPVVRGVRSTYPPSGLFPKYVKETKRTGITPTDFLRKSGY